MIASFVFLTTDILLFLLLGLLVIGIFVGCRSQQFRVSWQQLLKKPLAMSALVFLLFYLFVGMLDSIHFRIVTEQGSPSIKVYSVLDTFLDPHDEILEKTYSAPLATHSYSKESRNTPDGRIVRVYAPLNHVPGEITAAKHLYHADIVSRIVRSTIFALTMWLLLGVVIVKCIAGKQSFKQTLETLFYGKTEYAWRSLFLTFGILLFFITISRDLSVNYHLLGTNKVGQDVFYECFKGVRTALMIGSLTILFMLPFAILFGTAAGYFGGVIDDVIQYIYTTLSSIPGVLLIAAAILSIQIYIDNHPASFPSLASRADARLLALCLILGITSWTSLCRVLRAETLKLRELDYIQAVKVLGAGHFRVILGHIVPNLVHIILITVVLDFSNLVLAEAVLTYVGVGVDPTTFSWGNMIDSARLELAREPAVWWPLLGAFGFMFIFVLSANIFADALRDAFDPRTRFAH